MALFTAKKTSQKFGIIKKAETLSQFFGPTSTYENNPLRDINTYPNLGPNHKNSF
ncbi:hypothetical protein [Mucilaginibacter sp. 3215]|uniref:hypothetical protein n=1 Tax=Mucilaginibacter sp. 3215 TaxID=3373912 RepID=UPI003D25EF25